MSVQARREPPSSPIGSLLARPRPSLFNALGLLLVLLLIVWLVVNAVKTPADFFEVFLIGLTTGAVFALVALGYTLVYGILQLINFAHGDVFSLCGLIASSFITSLFNLSDTSSALGIVGGLAVTFVAAAVIGAAINSSIEFVAYRRLRNAPR